MLNIGPGEFILILIAVILFVPSHKLPEMATSLGRFLGQLQRGFQDFRRSLTLPNPEKWLESPPEQPKSKSESKS